MHINDLNFDSNVLLAVVVQRVSTSVKIRTVSIYASYVIRRIKHTLNKTKLFDNIKIHTFMEHKICYKYHI